MLEWLESVGIKAVLDWAWNKLLGILTAWRKDQSDHNDSVSQANQDTDKASKLTPDSSAKDVSDAIDDELSHM